MPEFRDSRVKLLISVDEACLVETKDVRWFVFLDNALLRDPIRNKGVDPGGYSGLVE
jgi:hypothetical protein